MSNFFVYSCSLKIQIFNDATMANAQLNHLCGADFVKVHLGDWEWDVDTFIYRSTQIPGPRRGIPVTAPQIVRATQSFCSNCGQEVPQRWLDAGGVCLSCGGGNVRTR
jgi:hypothetical protein